MTGAVTFPTRPTPGRRGYLPPPGVPVRATLSDSAALSTELRRAQHVTTRCPTCGRPVAQTGRRGRPRVYCRPACRPNRRRPGLTHAHRTYLYCFDLYLHAHGDEERHAAWQLMRRAGTDAGIPVVAHRPDRAYDLVDRLARWVRAQEAG